MRVPSVIKEDAAASNAVLRPMMDRAFVVGGGANDVASFSTVVERSGRDVSEVAEAVPLGSGLRVEMV